MSKNDRYVVKQGKGWAVKQGGVATPESVHRKQSSAEKAAKDTVRDLGSGEVRIQDRQAGSAIRTRCRRATTRFRRVTGSTEA